MPRFERVFDERAARDDLAELRRDGPGWFSQALIDGLAGATPAHSTPGGAAPGGSDILTGATVIDIGAGTGAVHLALLERGASTAIDVDGSAPYVASARDEASRRGLSDRVTYRVGDVTEIGPTLDPADLVALDRVVCCYPDVDALLGTAAALTRRRIGLVYPRDDWWIRLGAALANPWTSWRWGGYRMFVHRRARVAGILEAAGLRPRHQRVGRVWRIEIWDRPAATGPDPYPSVPAT